MFGLLKLDPDVINNDNDFMIYQAHYCGLCKSLATEYGQLSRVITNYEVTLISLLLTSQRKLNAQFTKVRCPVSLQRKGAAFPNSSDLLADISIVLFYEKLLDNEFDEKKNIPMIIRNRMGKKYKQAQNKLSKYLFDTEYIHNLMEKQRRLEGRGIHSLDCISEQTASMMAYIFKFLSGFNNEALANQQAFKALGFHLGKWIYIMDSLIDLEQDSLLRRFNPFLLKCGFTGNKLQIHEIPEIIKADIKVDLLKILRDIRAALSQITFYRNRNLIEGVVIKNLELKTTIVCNALERNSKNSRKKLRVLQASVAGVLIPETVFASNGMDQLCESFIGPILVCGIVIYGFKTIFKCGHVGCCSNSSHPKEVQVKDGCGGKKTYKRDLDGTYRERSACC